MTKKNYFFTFKETQAYCIAAYEKASDEDKSSLKKLYGSLRQHEPKLPANPVFFYKDKGWESIGHIFGLEKIQFFIFKEAQAYCITAYDKASDEDKSSLKKLYHSLRQHEPKLPASPVFFYKDKGWESIGHIFGLEKKQLFTFKEAQAYCIAAYEKASDEDKSSFNKLYDSLRQHEPKLPASPVFFYKDKGWESISHVFGLEKKQLFTFKEAQAYCIAAYEKASDEDKSSFRKFYHSLRQHEPKLPASPGRAYKDKGWESIGHVFGLEKQQIFTFKEAQAYCIEACKKASNKDKSSFQKLYLSLREHEPKLPANPQNLYKDKGWKSTAHIFGLEKKQFFTFTETQEYCTEALSLIHI